MSEHQKECSNCKTTKTPAWRCVEDGKLVCNACGLYYQMNRTHRGAHRASRPAEPVAELEKETNYSLSKCLNCQTSSKWERDETGTLCCSVCMIYYQLMNKKDSGPQKECSNCKTTKTPAWRCMEAGKLVCNACGLYYRMNRTHRPIHENIIQKKMQSKAKSEETHRASLPAEPVAELEKETNYSLSKCLNCQTSSKWERDETGTLCCSVCMIYYQLMNKKDSGPQKECSNCKTTKTPAWRCMEAGKLVCNACGLYYQMNRTHRPIHEDIIQKKMQSKAKSEEIFAPGSILECLHNPDSRVPILSGYTDYNQQITLGMDHLKLQQLVHNDSSAPSELISSPKVTPRIASTSTHKNET